MTVEAPPTQLVPATVGRAPHASTWSEHYDSETSRVTTTLNVEMLTQKGLPIRLHVVNLTKARDGRRRVRADVVPGGIAVLRARRAAA